MEEIGLFALVVLSVTAIVGFTGGFVGEVLYASRLLNERRRASDEPSMMDSRLATLSAGWIASWRAKRVVPELEELAKHNGVVARDLPRFLFCRRARQAGFVLGALMIVFFG